MARKRKQQEKTLDEKALVAEMVSWATRSDRMAEALQAARLKRTPQRVAIIRELVSDPTHPTAQELFDRLRPEQPTLSFATVYNTLAALTDRGLCAARPLTRGPLRYDPNVGPHDHAVCDSCGLATDVPIDNKSVARGRVLDGFRVRAVERIYRGLCAECAGRASKSAQGEPAA